MGKRCWSKWQKRCYPIALRGWEIGHVAFEQFPSFPRIKISIPWASDLLWAAHLGHFTNLSGGDLLDTSGLLLFLKLSKGLLYLRLFPPFAWHGVGYPRRDACRALKWGRLSVGSLKTTLCPSTCSILLQRKPGRQEQRQSRAHKVQFYSKWNLKPTTRNKRFLRSAVVRKGEHIFQANCKIQEILGSLFIPSDIKEKEETLSSINHIFKNFPILLPVFVLGQQIVYRNKINLLYLFRRKCLLYHLLALVRLFIQKQQEKGFCIKNSQGQGFLFLMLAESSLASLTTISKSISDSNLIASLQGDISQLQVSCSEHRAERDFRTKIKVSYCLSPYSCQSQIKLIKPTKGLPNLTLMLQTLFHAHSPLEAVRAKALPTWLSLQNQGLIHQDWPCQISIVIASNQKCRNVVIL